MKTRMRSRNITIITISIGIGVFIVFVILFENHTRKKAQDQIDEHARVIAEDLWNYNYQSAGEYLNLACKSDNYELLVVKEPDGKIFKKVKDRDAGAFAGLLKSLKLIPAVSLSSVIVYNAERIGVIEAIWRPRSIYVHFYVFFIFVLGVVIFLLFMRNLQAKYNLEDRVEARTSELAAMNASLQKEVRERKKTEEELVKAKEQAEESNRLKTAFLANISHEIRTPMNGIIGFTDVLKDKTLPREQQQHYVRIIEQSGVRMLNTLNDLISISKIEAGQVEVSFSQIDVHEKLKNLYTFFRPEAQKKGLNLIFDSQLQNNENILTTDADKFVSIMSNLIKNAIKYTDAGSITLSYQRKGATLEFCVKDTGIGISQDRRESIFDRFVQADPEDRDVREGSGLGLSISKAYAHLLGGDIRVESEPGKGSSLYLVLPFDINTEEKKTSNNDESVSREPIFLKDLSILVAEDEESSYEFLGEILKSRCRKLIFSYDGDQTIQAMQDHPDIDIILLDIKMPLQNGYEVTHKIRQFNKDVKIIAQTAYALAGDREKALEAGCDAYVAKPFKKDELMAVIKSLI